MTFIENNINIFRLVEPDLPHFPFADERKFETTGNWEEFFMWMEGPFLGVMFRNTWYNDQPRGNYSKSGAPKRYLGKCEEREKKRKEKKI